MPARTRQVRRHRVSAEYRADCWDPRTQQTVDENTPLPATPLQIRFLEDCTDTPDPFERVMARFGLSSRRLSEWLGNPNFCQRIIRFRERLADRHERIVVGLEAEGWHRRAAVTLVRLARDLESHQRADGKQDPLSAILSREQHVRKKHRFYRGLIRAMESH